MTYTVSKSVVNSKGSLYMSDLGAYVEKEGAYRCIERDLKQKHAFVFKKGYKVYRDKDVFVINDVKYSNIIGYQILDAGVINV